MSERTTFMLKIVGFVVACILLALAIYFTFFKQPSAIAPEEIDAVTGSGSLPTSGAGTAGGTIEGEAGTTEDGVISLVPSKVAKGGTTFTTLLTNTGVESPTVTANGNVAYYDPADGKFYTIDPNGNAVALSQQTFPKAETVTFSSGAGAAVIEYPDGSNIVYDFNTAQQVTLPSHWEDFSFSETGEDIAAKSIGTDESNRALVITSADGSSTTVVAALGNNDDKVTPNWSPDSSVVAFSATGVNSGGTFGRQEIYLVGQDGSATGVLFVDGSNFQAIWATDGKHLLYSVADPNDGYKAALWYADSNGDRNGDGRRKMGIQTLVSKCTFFSATIAYCAVPREMPAGGGSDTALITSYDDLYKLNVSTGTAKLVAIPAADTNMFSLNVSEDESVLYFSDSAGRLNMIRLK